MRSSFQHLTTSKRCLFQLFNEFLTSSQVVMFRIKLLHIASLAMSEYTNQNLSNINIIALISHITGVHKGIKVQCSRLKTEKLWEILSTEVASKALWWRV